MATPGAISPGAAWGVTPETARLLKHWCDPNFAGLRPLFCHVGLLGRARAALARGGLEGVVLDGAANPPEGRVAMATMHRAKGLEYRAVAVTRALDELWVSGVAPGSDYLADL